MLKSQPLFSAELPGLPLFVPPNGRGSGSQATAYLFHIDVGDELKPKALGQLDTDLVARPPRVGCY
jgi:hypothetical protein